ncbi:hypothetical protein MTR_8g062400 [Medicago truncatula]|uniref:Transmembrane protein n=1 Tax=Medicago truncatula TaxID=3880 RepID=G7LEM8_MEDTR|nr:hypothetical protein MTR_8g062400 [Medicago truncatula]
MIISFGVVLLLLLLIPYLPETNRTDPSHQLVLYIFRGGSEFSIRENDVRVKLLIVPNESAGVHLNHGRVMIEPMFLKTTSHCTRKSADSRFNRRTVVG